MKRRELLRGGAAAGAGLVFSAAGVYALSQDGGGAAVNIALQDDSTVITGEGDDGEVQHVNLDITAEISYQNFANEVQEIEMFALADTPPGDDTVGGNVNIFQTTHTAGEFDLSSPYTYEWSGDLMEHTMWEESDFNVEEDGETQTHEIQISFNATVRDGERATSGRAGHMLVVEITNTDNNGDPQASVSLSLAGDVEMGEQFPDQ